jgi:peptide/nickel transport system substrate-binding protein
VLTGLILLTVILSGCQQGQSTTGQTAQPAQQQPAQQQPAQQQPAQQDGDQQDGPGLALDLDEEERRKTVIWDLDTGKVENPDVWNPFLAESRREKGFHQAMVEPVFILNYETGAIEPWLGEMMTSNQSLDVWTLTLRDGVTWSDGEAFDADDVVFTVQSMLDNPELDKYFGVTEWLESVEKVDDLTVRFTLTGPNPRFQVDYFSVKFWGSFPIVPEHIWSQQDDLLSFKNYDPEKGWPVFTGPYKVENVSNTTFVYVRDDNWWGAQSGFKPLPTPEKLIWIANESEQDRIAMAAANQLDSLGDITLEGFESLRAQNANVIAWFDGLPYSWMDPCSRLLSLNNTVEPWDDKEMRWAINYAIDREVIVERAYQGTTFPSKHFFPAYPPLNRYVQLMEDEGLYQEYPLTTNDPQEAMQIIESKGWVQGADGFYERDGEPLSLEIQVLEEFVEKQEVAQVLAHHLQAVGIQTTVSSLNNSTWTENLELGEYEAIIDWEACGSVHEPWASMDRYHARWVQPVGEPATGRNNHVRWENDAYSDLVDQIGSLPLGDPEIDTLFVEAMESWLDELPFIPITQAKKLIPFDTTYWTGWPTTDNNYVHPPSWWQSTHMIIHNLEPVE